MLVALPQFGKEQLLATLVVFRILYFMIPFGIAISIMGTRELWLNVVQPWQLRRKQAGACTVIDTDTAEVVEVKATTLHFQQRSRAGSRR